MVEPAHIAGGGVDQGQTLPIGQPGDIIGASKSILMSPDVEVPMSNPIDHQHPLVESIDDRLLCLRLLVGPVHGVFRQVDLMLVIGGGNEIPGQVFAIPGVKELVALAVSGSLVIGDDHHPAAPGSEEGI